MERQMPDSLAHKRRWRFYRTAGGNEPVKSFLDQLTLDDRNEVLAAMKDIAADGIMRARHLRDDIYEVRANGVTNSYRILFATEGRYSQVLLALESFAKKTQKTPNDEIDLARARLADWRNRGA